MKRFTLLMAAIVCLATSAMAQIAENQTLPTTLWKQGLATCAHYTAHARGFAKKIDEIKAKYPGGYTLDDLNEVYSNQGRKWEKIYNQFKEEEGKAGSIADLKEMVGPQIWKLVEPEFQAFITDHPEAAQELPAQPDEQKADEQKEDTNNEAQDTSTQVTGVAKTGQKSTSCPVNLPLWLGILGTLLGLCALLTALSNRGKINQMRRTFARELDRTNANLQEFSTDAAEQMKALSIRLTGKAIRHNVAEEPDAVEPENFVAPIDDIPVDDEPIGEVPVEDEELVAPVIEEETVLEPRTYYMGKPDEDDNFTRVTDDFEYGNSIYVLTTTDGKNGTFEVIDKPEVHHFALMMPTENLIRACSGNAIQIPNGTRIITDRPGKAELVDGTWRVIEKAIIHYAG